MVDCTSLRALCQKLTWFHFGRPITAELDGVPDRRWTRRKRPPPCAERAFRGMAVAIGEGVARRSAFDISVLPTILVLAKPTCTEGNTRLMMHTRWTLFRGLNGTKRLVEQYGDRLVCVRYGYDAERKRRYKTVELIMEPASATANAS